MTRTVLGSPAIHSAPRVSVRDESHQTSSVGSGRFLNYSSKNTTMSLNFQSRSVRPAFPPIAGWGMLGEMDTSPKRRGPLLWLANRSRRFLLIATLGMALPILYPLAYGPWLWIRSGWYRQGSSNNVSYEHPIWEPMYFFHRHIARPPEPMWGDYQRWWIQPKRTVKHPAKTPDATR
jgi:hypothetical protein